MEYGLEDPSGWSQAEILDQTISSFIFIYILFDLNKIDEIRIY